MTVHDMPAGPEMDRMVAERVMGWAVHNRNSACYVEAAWVDKVTPPEVRWQMIDDWRPSTNLAQAWEVVEKLMRDGADMDFTVRVGARTTFAVFHSYRVTPLPDEMSAASTAPLAMCYAALAVGAGHE